MTSSESSQDLLKLAVEVAEEAARLIVERRRGHITVADTKSTVKVVEGRKNLFIL